MNGVCKGLFNRCHGFAAAATWVAFEIGRRISVPHNPRVCDRSAVSPASFGTCPCDVESESPGRENFAARTRIAAARSDKPCIGKAFTITLQPTRKLRTLPLLEVYSKFRLRTTTTNRFFFTHGVWHWR